jgi:hypothetical protein
MFVVMGVVAFASMTHGASAAQATAGYHTGTSASDGPTISAQTEPQNDNSNDDTRVPVQLWTVFGAVAAGCVLLVLQVVRFAMGWVKRPGPQDEAHH